MKEICRGEVTYDEIFSCCEKIAREELHIEFPRKMFNFMLSKSGSKMFRKAM